MKAYITHQFGSPEVLKLHDVEKPKPEDNEVLIRVEATTVNALAFFMNLNLKP